MSAPATGIGAARITIAVTAAFLALLCVAVAAITGLANGVLVLATLFAVIFAWAIGAFTRNFWH